jgi:glutamyl-tRNA synthetase
MPYKAFGWEDSRHRFAHLSLPLKPVGNGKLSKRDGDKMGFPVFPLRWVAADGTASHGYREDGYFPEAFVNMLAMLGWNPGDDRELFTMDSLIEAFSMDKVQKAGAKFNPDKAKWFNKEYLRMKSDEELTDLFVPVLEANGIKVTGCPKCPVSHDFAAGSVSWNYVKDVVALIKERATFVQDFWTIAHYLFIAPTEFVPKDVDKFYKPEIYAVALEAMEHSDADSLEGYVRDHGMPMGKVMNCIRLALSGAASGLGISDILHFIGHEEGLRRMHYLKEAIG